MRRMLLSLLSLLIGAAACAQLTLLPQVGFEQSRTPLQVNDGPSFAPLGGVGTLKANVRLDYQFKKWGGPFIGVGTRPAVVAYRFTDPATVIDNVRAAAGHLQWRVEGGYQYSSSPLYFKKPISGKTATPGSTTSTSGERHCIYSQCREKKTQVRPAKKDERLNVRIQPSAGMAYNLSTQQEIERNGPFYQYRAGNWKTAFLTSVAFEFAKGATRLFNLGAHYTKALGNLNTPIFSTQTDSKTTAIGLRSKASSWAITLGVPIILIQKKTAIVNVINLQRTEHKNHCERYSQNRCTRKVML